MVHTLTQTKDQEGSFSVTYLEGRNASSLATSLTMKHREQDPPSGLRRQNKSIANTLKQALQIDPDPRSLMNLLTGISIYSNNSLILFLAVLLFLSWN